MLKAFGFRYPGVWHALGLYIGSRTPYVRRVCATPCQNDPRYSYNSSRVSHAMCRIPLCNTPYARCGGAFVVNAPSWGNTRRDLYFFKTRIPPSPPGGTTKDICFKAERNWGGGHAQTTGGNTTEGTCGKKRLCSGMVTCRHD